MNIVGTAVLLAKRKLIMMMVPFRFCQRYPPTVVVIDEKEAFRSPEVHDTDWCGEWLPKPDEAEEWLDKANKRMENKGR